MIEHDVESCMVSCVDRYIEVAEKKKIKKDLKPVPTPFGVERTWIRKTMANLIKNPQCPDDDIDQVIIDESWYDMMGADPSQADHKPSGGTRV